jgi:hypothetical protein
MAWQLVREVLNSTRVRLTRSEFAVLVVIAEECRDVDTRTCSLERELIAARSKMSTDGVRRALRGLRNKGLDPRVPIPGMYGSDGEPVYAFPGRPCTYRLPALVDEPDKADPEADPEGGQNDPPKGGKNRPPRRPRKGGQKEPPTRAEVGAARAAAVAACDDCDEWGYLLGPDGSTVGPPVVNHHPRGT